ncbi:GNAT family N-acetyltransferase [Marine Group I thaumarchaeote]|jgi:glucosamine-phosphate N-acetyltransferase|uniref:glucosamine-phosphate N-acetyltransferase n=1 Tax=Marine Group I thaumarchaeote TaxID=2511932 RepID=A0A7K4MU92_9ARCH|nr:MAG: GNAT family N-acetyltransferase [Nitrosopumilus sp. YT1]NMI81620.1 GNAT family N-acetyltransferase [Candidatus Nitrosopumilus sp. MTA1]NWJ19555.1 GNAT family N-acetyltransferase [Marine Group I thaumarchaeote]NWJ56876.1 GNAT family N-acetyltransferase [Marine Group I thaumarchaeote]NWJ83879.1 GNAT family N-acetyltransferase [Marine Group I thaumarchaeote]
MSEPIIRELRKEDLGKGFLATLDSLRQTSDIERNKAEEIFEKISSNPDHVIVVAELDGKIVGTTTLLIEIKFIHSGGLVGHIEDVVVDKNFQGQRIGEKIMKYLLEFAKNRGCYKTILDCTDDVKPFYEKLGFKHIANELRFDHI